MKMWTWVKRVFLFSMVNILVLTTISITFHFVTAALGIQLSPDMTMWAFYAAIGMGGAFVSLLLSKVMAKMMMKIKIISPDTRSSEEREILETVYRIARRANLPKMPEVGIYESPEINAFATGPSKRNSLVAVSTGIVAKMNKDELEGVLAHEVAHIANGDMVTMTLIQGVINTMVLIIARILSSVIANQGSDRGRPWLQFVIFQVLQVLLSLLGSIVVCYFSRAREFRADAGSAHLVGKDKMVAALRALGKNFSVNPNGAENEAQNPSLATLKIAGGSASSFAKMFSTHPPLEERIQALQSAHSL